MRFDDTLETVLAADVSTPHGRASAWRQIVDLIGRGRVPPDDRALNLLAEIRALVPVGVRAASARALEHSQPPAALAMLCALDELPVAAPVLRGARLNSGEWIELLPRLSPAGRAVLRGRQDLPPGIEQALAGFAADFTLAADAETLADIPLVVGAQDTPADPQRDAVSEVQTVASVPAPEEAGEHADVTAREGDVSQASPGADGNIETAAPVPALPATAFVSIGTAAMGIPVVAAAIHRAATRSDELPVLPEGGADAGQSGMPMTQSETSGEAFVETPIASESEAAHDLSMSEEETILAVRDDAAADDGSRLSKADTDAADGPFEIAEVVARIDEFYSRQSQSDRQPTVPRGEGFRFETDEQGIVRWVDGVARTPLIGLSLDMTATAEGSQVDGVAAGAFRRRSGFSDARLFVAGESDAAGDWRISATAAFDPASGRFSGYRGVARRPRADEHPVAPEGSASPADSMRQLMHELRTPTNAIAGFAELIEREMLGEAPAIYRARAATIRDHARALLAAIDDLDIAARIEASALRLYPAEIALRPLLGRIVEDLGALASARKVRVALPTDNPGVTGDARAIERLLSRMLATLVAAAGEGEQIDVRLDIEADDMVAIAFSRPRALAAYAGDAVFGIDDEREEVALLGTGFAMRLIRNLASELSGSFASEAERFTLRLPAAVTKSLELAR